VKTLVLVDIPPVSLEVNGKLGQDLISFPVRVA